MTVTGSTWQSERKVGMTDSDTARRYRRAAEAALEQLDWCVIYLQGARKNDLARAVSRNRDQIRQRLRERPASEVERQR
jgi:hypothetical protein